MSHGAFRGHRSNSLRRLLESGPIIRGSTLPSRKYDWLRVLRTSSQLRLIPRSGHGGHAPTVTCKGLASVSKATAPTISRYADWLSIPETINLRQSFWWCASNTTDAILLLGNSCPSALLPGGFQVSRCAGCPRHILTAVS